jgi:hypothetical protein
MARRSYWPIWQLTLSRLKEFLRQPAAIWVYGFPLMITVRRCLRDDPVGTQRRRSGCRPSVGATIPAALTSLQATR